ncbi:hypothetical protein NC651_040438 [Populus alba x Populus x berolinensis]|nr:hypothetical protein NC651_040438 [Populus alba x Populus x berolinensis]
MSVLLSIKMPFSWVHSLSMAMAGLHLVKKVWGLYKNMQIPLLRTTNFPKKQKRNL